MTPYRVVKAMTSLMVAQATIIFMVMKAMIQLGVVLEMTPYRGARV